MGRNSSDRYTPPGHHRDLASFRQHWSGVASDLGVVDAVAADGALSRTQRLFGATAGNRFCIHPMEGWDAEGDGTPSELGLRRWRRFGRSGAGLIWGGEAFAVRADGKANANQLFLNDAADMQAALASLLAELRAGHAEVGGDPDLMVVGLQLTHSGRWSRPEGKPVPRTAARDVVLDRRVGIETDAALLSDDELREIGARYVLAARLAQEAGFHFVDVKCCHGYLLHELLGAVQRPGPYGGSFENRTRLLREIVAGIRSECPELGIGVRVSIADVGPYRPRDEDRIGMPDVADETAIAFARGEVGDAAALPAESVAFLELCQSLGVEAVNLTLGSPYYCPHLQRPAAYPPSDGYLPPEDPLLSVARHLRTARACKARVPGLLTVGTGYTYLQEWLAHVAEHEVAGGHVDFVGLGRMVLSYPELPRDVLAGEVLQKKLICRTFSDCTTAPRNGMISGCYPLDAVYRARPEAARLKALKRELSAGT